MKLLAVLGVFLLPMSLSAQRMNSATADSIVSAVALFVESAPKDKYEAFLMKIYRDSTQESNTCLSLTYIRNSNESIYISPYHYMKVGDRFVQVSLDVPDDEIPEIETALQLSELRRRKRIELIQQLYPSVMGVISYHNPANLVLCWNKEITFKKRYTNGFEIPVQHRIRPSLDKSRIEFKKLEPDEMLRRMKNR